MWSIDRDSLEQAIDAGVRARARREPEQSDGIDAAAPTTASGSWTLCARRDLAIIADEVFADYPLAPRR